MKSLGRRKTLDSLADDEGERKTRHWLRLCTWALVTTTVLFAAVATANLYGALTHNPQGEFCRYVPDGETFHIKIEGYPCRLTSMAALTFFATYAIPAIPLQGLLLTAWFILRRHRRQIEQAR